MGEIACMSYLKYIRHWGLSRLTCMLLFIAIPTLFKMNGADSEPSRQMDRILVTIANKLEQSAQIGRAFAKKIFNSQNHGRWTFFFHVFSIY